MTLTHADFIERAMETHGPRYDYSSSRYVHNKEKLVIICKIHGPFVQIPSGHMRGKGCPKCGGTSKLSTDEFIKAAQMLHCGRYNYDLSDYVNAATKVKIGCKVHGIFEQRPNRHLAGEGCPKCSMSKGELKIKDCLEKLGVSHQQQVKFDSCRNKRSLPFDFMVEGRSLIEYHGEQHYELVSFSQNPVRAKMKFQQTQRHDEIKKNWCLENNIPLLIVPYWETDVSVVVKAFVVGGHK